MTGLKSLPVFIFIAFSIVALAIFAAPQTSLTSVPKTADAGGAPAEAQTSLTDRKTAGESLIGYRHKGVTRGEKLPNGAQDLGGGLLSDDDYGVSRFLMGGKFMLWFEKIVDRDEAGVPDWEVKDVLVFDKLKKNQVFLYSYSSPCVIGGEEDLDLIVLAETSAKKRRSKVVKAWRANLAAEKFEEVSTDAVTCQ
jgi:hypothetical protein